MRVGHCQASIRKTDQDLSWSVFFDLYKTEKLRLPVNSHAVVRNLSDVDLFVGVLA